MTDVDDSTFGITWLMKSAIVVERPSYRRLVSTGWTEVLGRRIGVVLFDAVQSWSADSMTDRRTVKYAYGPT